MQSTDRIRIQLNGEEREVPPDLTVRDLLFQLELEPGMVVVEHNGEILRRGSYEERSVRPGDMLELVHFVGGG